MYAYFIIMLIKYAYICIDSILQCCSSIYQLWSDDSKHLLSEHFQNLSDLHQFERDTILGEWMIQKWTLWEEILFQSPVPCYYACTVGPHKQIARYYMYMETTWKVTFWHGYDAVIRLWICWSFEGKFIVGCVVIIMTCVWKAIQMCPINGFMPNHAPCVLVLKTHLVVYSIKQFLLSR